MLIIDVSHTHTKKKKQAENIFCKSYIVWGHYRAYIRLSSGVFYFLVQSSADNVTEIVL